MFRWVKQLHCLSINFGWSKVLFGALVDKCEKDGAGDQPLVEQRCCEEYAIGAKRCVVQRPVALQVHRHFGGLASLGSGGSLARLAIVCKVWFELALPASIHD